MCFSLSGTQTNEVAFFSPPLFMGNALLVEVNVLDQQGWDRGWDCVIKLVVIAEEFKQMKKGHLLDIYNLLKIKVETSQYSYTGRVMWFIYYLHKHSLSIISVCQLLIR